MYGPGILVRTLTKPTRVDRYGNRWQYHSRSDHHSKIACWGIVFDLVQTCPLLNRHIAAAKIAFGINHEMRDFQHDRKKKLDLVLCTPASDRGASRSPDLGAGMTLCDAISAVTARMGHRLAYVEGTLKPYRE